jgi:hypothetical protein
MLELRTFVPMLNYQLAPDEKRGYTLLARLMVLIHLYDRGLPTSTPSVYYGI